LKKEREELWRGLRSFIQDAGAELADFTNGSSAQVRPAVPPKTSPPADPPAAHPPAPPAAEPPAAPRPAASTRLDQPIRPILKLVRDVPQPDPAPQPSLEELTLHLPKKGVCAAYFANKRCWELPDAYCNHALHICRLRECPVYDLHREEMERRFAAKFKHLW
jgi:hypothetical protein